MIGPESSETVYDVVVVGAGAAGVGVAVALKHAGIENFLVSERHTVGRLVRLMAGRDSLHHALVPNQFGWHARFELDRDWNVTRVQFGGRASDG